jgi:hypothetical protein
MAQWRRPSHSPCMPIYNRSIRASFYKALHVTKKLIKNAHKKVPK